MQQRCDAGIGDQLYWRIMAETDFPFEHALSKFYGEDEDKQKNTCEWQHRSRTSGLCPARLAHKLHFNNCICMDFQGALPCDIDAVQAYEEDEDEIYMMNEGNPSMNKHVFGDGAGDSAAESFIHSAFELGKDVPEGSSEWLLSQFHRINNNAMGTSYTPTENPGLYRYYGMPKREDEELFKLADARRFFEQPDLETVKRRFDMNVPDVNRFFGLAAPTMLAAIDNSIQRFYRPPDEKDMKPELARLWNA